MSEDHPSNATKGRSQEVSVPLPPPHITHKQERREGPEEVSSFRHEWPFLVGGSLGLARVSHCHMGQLVHDLSEASLCLCFHPTERIHTSFKITIW